MGRHSAAAAPWCDHLQRWQGTAVGGGGCGAGMSVGAGVQRVRSRQMHPGWQGVQEGHGARGTGQGTDIGLHLGGEAPVLGRSGQRAAKLPPLPEHPCPRDPHLRAWSPRCTRWMPDGCVSGAPRRRVRVPNSAMARCFGRPHLNARLGRANRSCFLAGVGASQEFLRGAARVHAKRHQ